MTKGHSNFHMAMKLKETKNSTKTKQKIIKNLQKNEENLFSCAQDYVNLFEIVWNKMINYYSMNEDFDFQ